MLEEQQKQVLLDIKLIADSLQIPIVEQIITQILQKQNSLFPQLIARTFDEDEWDDKFYMIVAKFEGLKKGIQYFDYGNR